MTRERVTVELSPSGGTGVIGLLAVTFIAFKITGFIDWSWWWVLAPFWGPPVLALLFLVLASGGMAAVAFVSIFHK